MNELIVVCGPTASGKTSLGIQLAQKFNTEIISADSRQLFKEMTIGTAKPSEEELALVPHHFINSHSISTHYSAGKFEDDAINCLSELFNKHNTVILVGGSGLYIQAVTDGFDELPDIDMSLRDELKNRVKDEGLETLYAELVELDPEYATKLNRENKQRILRALEVIITSGKTFTSLRQQHVAKRPFKVTKVAIDWDRKVLYDRINFRVDEMIRSGLEVEAKRLHPMQENNALQTVGYSEFFDYFDAKIDRTEAIRLIKRNTRRFAKRQLTWFRRDESIIWIKPNELDDFVESL